MSETHDKERARLDAKRWIQTASGLPFQPLSPIPEAVRIEDIAHALSMKCRFTGHTRRFYSVAQHCYHVSQLVPPSYALAGLLHDAGEAYLPDLAAPIKHKFYVSSGDGKFEPFAVVEHRIDEAIFAALGLSDLLPLVNTEAVKKADLRMLATEVRDLMCVDAVPTVEQVEHEEWVTTAPLRKAVLADWHLTEEAATLDLHYPLGPEEAERLYLQRFKELMG